MTHAPRVPYRETIRGSAKVEGRHKKQTGGRGQFGHVWLEIEPNPGGGVEFETKVVGGVVPKQFFPGVEKGVRDVAERGRSPAIPSSISRPPSTTARSIPSTPTSSRSASQRRWPRARASHEADPVLLEPIMDVEVRVPEAYMGEVNRDLNTRRGRVLGMDADGGQQVLRAHVPQAELFTYATELRSITGGRGTFSADPGAIRGGARARRPEGHRGPQGGGTRGRLTRSAIAASSSSGLTHSAPTTLLPSTMSSPREDSGAVGRFVHRGRTNGRAAECVPATSHPSVTVRSLWMDGPTHVHAWSARSRTLQA